MQLLCPVTLHTIQYNANFNVNSPWGFSEASINSTGNQKNKNKNKNKTKKKEKTSITN